MKKRLIDIYPSHAARTTLGREEALLTPAKNTSELPKQKISRKARFALFLIVLFALPPLVMHFFFARATVQVRPQITKLHIEERITAQTGPEKLNLEKKIIRARVFAEEKESTQLFSSSGKRFKAEKARGAIRIYNENSTKNQPLVANTRFISEDGKLFLLEKAVSIPGGGFFDAEVRAAAPGEEFNIDPSNFSLPGLVGSSSYTKIYGESFQAMEGGEQREVMVVTEEDIAAAKDQLTETLKTEAVKSLLAKIPPPYQMLQDSLVSMVLEDNSLVKPGAELTQFNYTVKIRVSMSGFNKEDADVLARHLLSNYFKGNQFAVNEKTLAITYNAAENGGNFSSIPLVVLVEAEQYEKIDTKIFTRRIEGVSDNQFYRVMSEYPFFAKAQFSLWPFWISSVPEDPRRINFEVLLEDLP